MGKTQTMTPSDTHASAPSAPSAASAASGAFAPVAADSGALPSLSDLDLRSRALYGGSVAVDYALRTGLGTIGAAAAVTGAISGVYRRDLGTLGYYADLAAEHDAPAVFPRPDAIAVEARPGRGPGVPGGRVELLRFDSPFVPLNPKLRRSYARHTNNGIARAQHWRHEDGPRPTLVVVHGFGASPAWFNVAFFSLRTVFANGWDVLLYTLPFHGGRRTSRGVNGIDLLRFGMAHLSEAMLHAIHDLRVFIDRLFETGAPRVGITGLSLGGYVSGLAAAVEDRLDFAVPNAAVVWLPPLLDAWFPASVTTKALRAAFGVDRDLLERALALHSPLNYAPLLPRDRLMVIAGLGDRLAPPEQSLMLWEHWERPELHWFPGSHVIHLGRRNYQEQVGRLMAHPRG
jgi:pimeloyl-ACP methyl ester carboxylesterase